MREDEVRTYTKVCSKCGETSGEELRICPKCGWGKDHAEKPVVSSGKALPAARPRVLSGVTVKAPSGCGNLYVVVNHDNGRPLEVFLILGRAGSCAHAMTESVGRLISLALRSGIQLEDVVRQLEGISCPCPLFHDGVQYSSCIDVAAKVLKEHLQTKGG